MSYNESHLERLKNTIEALPKNYQIQVLKILKEYPSVKLNENKSGIFVNMSFLSSDVIGSLDEYLNYIKEQESNLTPVEIQKSEFINTYFVA